MRKSYLVFGIAVFGIVVLAFGQTLGCGASKALLFGTALMFTSFLLVWIKDNYLQHDGGLIHTEDMGRLSRYAEVTPVFSGGVEIHLHALVVFGGLAYTLSGTQTVLQVYAMGIAWLESEVLPLVVSTGSVICLCHVLALARLLHFRAPVWHLLCLIILALLGILIHLVWHLGVVLMVSGLAMANAKSKLLPAWQQFSGGFDLSGALWLTDSLAVLPGMVPCPVLLQLLMVRGVLCSLITCVGLLIKVWRFGAESVGAADVDVILVDVESTIFFMLLAYLCLAVLEVILCGQLSLVLWLRQL